MPSSVIPPPPPLFHLRFPLCGKRTHLLLVDQGKDIGIQIDHLERSHAPRLSWFGVGPPTEQKLDTLFLHKAPLHTVSL